MTILVVQIKEITGAWAGSFGVNVTAGNTVDLVAFQYGGTSMGSGSPLFGGSAVTGASKLFDGESSGSGGVYGAAWMLPDVAGGAASVALTASGGGTIDSNVGMTAYEVSGLGASPVLDSTTPNPATASGNSTLPSSGATGNIASSPEFIIGAMVSFASNYGAPSSPWVNSQTGGFGNCQAGYQIATSSGSGYTYVASSASGGNQWFAGVAAVKAGSGGTPHTATAALTVTPSFTAARQRGKNRTASLTVTPTFTEARTRGKYRTGSLTVSPSFTAARTRGKNRPAR